MGGSRFGWVALVLLAQAMAFGCKNGESDGASPLAASTPAECKQRLAANAKYFRKLEGANVLTTAIAVPPAEGKGGKALSHDAERRFLFCEADGCGMGGEDGKAKAKVKFGADFAKGMAKALGEKCGSVYVAATDVLPRAKVDELLAALGKASCTAHAVVKESLSGLPKIDVNPDIGARLKKMSKTKDLGARGKIVAKLVKDSLKPHKKMCKAFDPFVAKVAKAESHERYDLVEAELGKTSKGVKRCLCDMGADDGKVLLQVMAFHALAFEMHVYKSRALPAAMLTGAEPEKDGGKGKGKDKGKALAAKAGKGDKADKAKGAKTWYELVAGL